MATAGVGVGLVGAIAVALGWRDRVAALLCLWVLASLQAANPLILNPALPHVGWLLLAHAAIEQPPWLGALLRDPDAGRDWRLPPAVFAAGWALMTLAYAYSGATKLAAPSWVDGQAMAYVLDNPLARDTGLRLWLLQQPALLMLATWSALALELLAPLLALSRRLRPWLWVALLVLQLGLLALVDFADLTWGMLVLQAWTFDPDWLPSRRRFEGRDRRRSTGDASKGVPSEPVRGRGGCLGPDAASGHSIVSVVS